MQEELRFNIRQCEQSLKEQVEILAATVAVLEAKLSSGTVPDITAWTDGFVSQDVARLTASLQRWSTLHQALRIVEKEEKWQ